jgi:hypothetical protein
MLCSMTPPLASATGYVTIFGSVGFALVFVVWLLRAEAQDTADTREEEEAMLKDESEPVNRA